MLSDVDWMDTGKRGRIDWFGYLPAGRQLGNCRTSSRNVGQTMPSALTKDGAILGVHP